MPGGFSTLPLLSMRGHSLPNYRTRRAKSPVDNKPDAVTYLRVSTARQTGTATDIDADGLSIATQREDCNAKAAQKRRPVIRELGPSMDRCGSEGSVQRWVTASSGAAGLQASRTFGSR